MRGTGTCLFSLTLASHASTSIGNEIVVLGGKSSELEARPMAVNWFNSGLKKGHHSDILWQI